MLTLYARKSNKCTNILYIKNFHIKKYRREKNNYNMKYRVVAEILLFRFNKSRFSFHIIR